MDELVVDKHITSVKQFDDDLLAEDWDSDQEETIC